MIGTAVGLALLLAIISGNVARAGDPEDVTAASDSLRTVVREALADEDGGRLASIFTEDGAVISPDGRLIRGRLTIKTSATLLFLTLGGGEIEISRHGISLIDSTAYETGRYLFRRPEDGSVRSWSGSYTAVWKKEAGRWKVACAIGLR